MVDFSKTSSASVDLKSYITDIPNFPIDGIMFKDIQPLLSNPKAFKQAIYEKLMILNTVPILYKFNLEKVK